MTRTVTVILALAATLAGMGGIAQTQAASRAVMMSSQTFENRCVAHDGIFAGGGDNYGCQLGELTMECTFFAANADCQWNGKSEQIAVVRLIGMPEYASLSSGGNNGVGNQTSAKPGGGGMKDKGVSDILQNAKF